MYKNPAALKIRLGSQPVSSQHSNAEIQTGKDQYRNDEHSDPTNKSLGRANSPGLMRSVRLSNIATPFLSQGTTTWLDYKAERRRWAFAGNPVNSSSNRLASNHGT
jgi:hypothetical protein